MTLPPATNGNDSIVGTDFDDFIDGLDGNDVLKGGLGNDTLLGGYGVDRLKGSAGADSMDGGEGGRDMVDYRDSDEGVFINLENNVVYGGHADGDTITGFEGAMGSYFDDILYGSAGDNRLYGYHGDDEIYAGDGADKVLGGKDNDWLFGDSGNDTMNGEKGFDTLYGGAGDDVLYGGDHNDVLVGGSGADFLDGGSGIDLADYITSVGPVSVDLSTGVGLGADAEGDSLTSIEWLYGTLWNDTLTGDAGANQIHGNGGLDVISGGAGNDTLRGQEGYDIIFGGDGDDVIEGGEDPDALDGGSGFDFVDYSTSDAGVRVDLTLQSNDTPAGELGHAQGDLLQGFEGIIGSSHNDTLRAGNEDVTYTLYGGAGDDIVAGGAYNDSLFGQDGNDALSGGYGDDTIWGGAGSDTIVAQQGNDIVYGGAGADEFRFLETAQRDHIMDFEAGSGGDVIVLYYDLAEEFSSFADVIAAATQLNNQTFIQFNTDAQIVLENVSVADLTADNFDSVF